MVRLISLQMFNFSKYFKLSLLKINHTLVQVNGVPLNCKENRLSFDYMLNDIYDVYIEKKLRNIFFVDESLLKSHFL